MYKTKPSVYNIAVVLGYFVGTVGCLGEMSIFCRHVTVTIFCEKVLLFAISL